MVFNKLIILSIIFYVATSFAIHEILLDCYPGDMIIAFLKDALLGGKVEAYSCLINLGVKKEEIIRWFGNSKALKMLKQ